MAKKRKRTKKKKSVSTLVIVMIMIFGWYTMMFPTSANLLNKIYNQNALVAYNESMVDYSNNDVDAIMENINVYNASIEEEQKASIFKYRGPTATSDKYKSIPTNSQDIGFIRIPALDVNIAFGHGTNDAMLQTQAGHLFGTSIPSDTGNIHAVIAAHSALGSGAKLFTDLGKLKLGDNFFVTILNHEYEYEVDQIKTVLPEDDYNYEQVEEGKNYVTLYTCTPYGVNNHRLLVRGHFVNMEIKDIVTEQESWTKYLPLIKLSSQLALVILAPFILLWSYAVYERIYRKKRKKRRRKKNEIRIPKPKENFGNRENPLV